MLAAAAMTLLKLAAGLLSGSLGVLSDAAHSGLDHGGRRRSPSSPCRSATSRPTRTTPTATASSRTLSAFGEVLLDGRLLRVDHLGGDPAHLPPHRGTAPLGLAGAVVLLAPSPSTSGARGGCARWPTAPARSALATDAFHFASDIWSSLAVLAGLGASWVGVTIRHRAPCATPTPARRWSSRC